MNLLRKTKIVCTLGPKTSAHRALKKLLEAGMNFARINLSHGSCAEHRRLIRTLKALRKEGHLLGILLDTKGPDLRTGDVKEPLKVSEGEEVLFTPKHIEGIEESKEKGLQAKNYKLKTGDEGQGGIQRIHVNCDSFARDVQEVKEILVDNGEIIFDVLEIRRDGTVLARARVGGLIGSRRHINLPGADLDLPGITEDDWKDIAFAAKEGVDFVALSFVREAEDVSRVKEFLRKAKSATRVIAKIETAKAVTNFREIMEVADGVMVARGDLGAELPFERIPAIQDSVTSLCQDAGKPVIVATHMLESMTFHPMPTRAEVTDVSHAVATGADATMLSGETSVGKYPILAVEAMDRIIRETERNLARFPKVEVGVHGEEEARAEAAVTIAETLDLPGIAVFTESPEEAMALSRCRPRQPIIAFVRRAELLGELLLYYGVFPVVLPFDKDPAKTLRKGFATLRKLQLFERGQNLVVVTDTIRILPL